MVLFGLKPSIDFVGGTLWEIKFEQRPELTLIKTNLDEKKIEYSSVQASQEDDVLLKLPPISSEKKEEIKSIFQEKFGQFEEIRFEAVGPTLGRELLVKTITGIVLAAVVILLYVAYRFKDKMYGVCAVLAMFHDTTILLGSFSLLGHFFDIEVDTLFVTAVLTILSFSVHDTVVVYDRVRESFKRYPKESFKNLVNLAINETLVRSLNNSFTIMFMLLALILLGGASIRHFVIALLIGTVAATYSSTFIATPLLLIWQKLKPIQDRKI